MNNLSYKEVNQQFEGKNRAGGQSVQRKRIAGFLLWGPKMISSRGAGIRRIEMLPRNHPATCCRNQPKSLHELQVADQ